MRVGSLVSGDSPQGSVTVVGEVTVMGKAK